MPILERRPHFIGLIREEVGRGFLFIPETKLEVGWIFILWSMLYLEGWSSTSSDFISVA